MSQVDIEVSAFFVYGTLKRNHLRSGLWPCEPLQVREGVVQADLFDLGPYPAAIPGDDLLLGELWDFRKEDMPAICKTLDEIEGYDARRSSNDYIRSRIVVSVPQPEGNQQSVEAWMYLGSDTSRLEQARRILPSRDFRGKLVAQWPDEQSRVPKSFAEE